MNSVLSCLVSDRVGPGIHNKELSKLAARYTGSRSGTALAGYHTAVEMALDSLNIKRGDPIMLSPLSPRLYYQIFEERGIVPVFIDVDMETGLMDIPSIEKNMDRAPKGLILYYTGGLIPDVGKILGFNIPVIEDITEGLGGRINEHALGGLGQVSVLGLAMNGIIGCDAGGILLVNERNLAKNFSERPVSEYCLLSDMSSSLALSQFNRIEIFISRRRTFYEKYVLSVMQGKHKCLKQKTDAAPVPFSFPIILNTGMNEVRQYALKKKIETIPAFGGSIAAHMETGCPAAAGLVMRCLLFPLYPLLSQREMDTILKVLATLP